MNRPRTASVSALILLLACGLCSAQDEEEKKLGWGNLTELTYIATQGNAEATSLGLRDTLTRTWEQALFTFELGALRASTGTIRRTAIGNANVFAVDTSTETEVTAESYVARGRFDREINERFFWFAGAGWDRNTFAGIQNRIEGVGGVGHVWLDTDSNKWRTDYGFGWVHQEDVVFNPDVDENFITARASSDYWRQLNATVEYRNVMILNENLSDTKDFRFDMVNSLGVAMTDRVAVKLSHQLLFDNRPSLGLLPLFSAAGVPAGIDVLSRLDRVDSIFNVAIVITY